MRRLQGEAALRRTQEATVAASLQRKAQQAEDEAGRLRLQLAAAQAQALELEARVGGWGGWGGWPGGGVRRFLAGCLSAAPKRTTVLEGGGGVGKKGGGA